MHKNNRTWAVIVAAGRGSRAGGEIPKQFRPVGGRAVLAASARAFLDHPQIDSVLVVINPDNRDLYNEAMAPHLQNPKLSAPVAGGAERQQSVFQGLKALKGKADLVLIHDAARPLVSPQTISDTLAALADHDGAIAAAPLTDTLKQERQTERLIGQTVPRAGLWRAQTPQTFHFEKILEAYEAAHEHAAGENFTDDASIAEAAGLSVALVPAPDQNMKITTEPDFKLAEQIMATHQARDRQTDMQTVVGQGFDVHRLAPGDGIDLCGVRIECPYSLIGHSDADVGLHAATDAILGALGDGDIGDHFPPTDERWRGVSSDRFLHHALELVDGHGGRLVHLDITLICEAPKIKPYRASMKARLAEITRLPAARLGLKATTTEALGFTGRREGIAAQAVATLELPASG